MFKHLIRSLNDYRGFLKNILPAKETFRVFFYIMNPRFLVNQIFSPTDSFFRQHKITNQTKEGFQTDTRLLALSANQISSCRAPANHRATF